jgi:hypothetical protein
MRVILFSVRIKFLVFVITYRGTLGRTQLLATNWMTGVRFPVEGEIFSSPLPPDVPYGRQNLVSKGCRNAFPQGKILKGETDHWHPFRAELRVRGPVL